MACSGYTFKCLKLSFMFQFTGKQYFSNGVHKITENIN